jgi:murein DD-endopeptidase MepM/ murein hydrolase activator NlpD
LDSSALHRPARHRSPLDQPAARHRSALDQPMARHRSPLDQPAVSHRSSLDRRTRRQSPDQAGTRHRSAAAARRAGSHRARTLPVEAAVPVRAPLWRRSPAVPAAVAVLAVWSGANAPHLLTPSQAGPLVTAAGVKLDLSALTGVGNAAPAGAATRPAGSAVSDSQVSDSQVSDSQVSDSRVSRTSRTLLGAGATDTAAPGRLPVPKPAKSARAARPAPSRSVQPPAERWVRPSAGAESSCFCMRWGEMHEGIDLAGPLGSPIVAVGDGVVVEAGPAAGFGLWVVIQHANGDYSIYGHMYTYYVTVGERVRAGQHIADIGANGQSTGPHLHFGIAHGSPFGPYLDPVPWLAARGVEVGAYDPDA